MKQFQQCLDTVMAAFSPCCDERKKKQMQQCTAFYAIAWRRKNTMNRNTVADNVGRIDGALLPMVHETREEDLRFNIEFSFSVRHLQ